MNREQFLKNIIGIAGAVAVAKYLPVPGTVQPVAESLVPGVGGHTFKLKMVEGWFNNYDVVRTSSGEEFIVLGDTLLSTINANLKGEIEWIPPGHYIEEVHKVYSCYPEI